MTEILTVQELATELKMSKRQVYELTASRTRTGSMRRHPIPVIKVNGNLRFLRSAIEKWLEELGEETS